MRNRAGRLGGVYNGLVAASCSRVSFCRISAGGIFAVAVEEVWFGSFFESNVGDGAGFNRAHSRAVVDSWFSRSQNMPLLVMATWW
jgi:hypothetical protein